MSNDRSAVVAVIGLGYVGLPLAVAFAEKGFPVVGIDVDGRKVDSLRRSESYVQDIPSARLAGVTGQESGDRGQGSGDRGQETEGKGFTPSPCHPVTVSPGHLVATTDFSLLAQCDAAIICVPTPLNKTRDPDVRYVIAAGESVAKHIHGGMLVVLESTTYPGTTEELLLPMLLEQGNKATGKPGDGETSRQGNKETGKQGDAPDTASAPGQESPQRRTIPLVPLSTPALSTTPRPFELRVLVVSATDPGEPSYRLALHQRAVEAPPDQRGLYEAAPEATRRVAELGGATLRAVADHVMESLRANGYKPTELGAGRREPFSLAEESGVRLALLFLAVRPITKVERSEVIAQGIRAMTSEEAYYWYAKCTGGPAAERAQRALRVLLAEE